MKTQTNILKVETKPLNFLESITDNINKGLTNTREVTCNLSHTNISTGKAICLNVSNNNTAYISKEYLSHPVFEGIDIEDDYKIDLLTLIYYGLEIVNKTNGKSLGNTTDDFPSYFILLEGGLQLYIYDNDAKAKKYFTILQNYKNDIKKIAFAIDEVFYPITDLQYYPPFAKKFKEYTFGIGYNPHTKKSCVKFW